MGTPRRLTAAAAMLPLSLVAAACGTLGPGDSVGGSADVRGIDTPAEALAAAMPEPVIADSIVARPARAVPVRAAVAVPAPTRTELDDVPDAALSAYHRAATVMREAAPECALEWPLLAAIGRVETKHGHGRLDDDGLASPALVGAPLNGRGQRPLVRDTDAGQLDGDVRWDRPVGPYRMLPSTWSLVAVDADTDGQRNPQDIDDAALGTAVLLCGRGHDLSTREAMRRALRRLRSEPGYPATVLSWYDAYVAAEAAMAVSTTVVAYGDWSGAVQQVADLARTRPPPAEEPPRKPKRKPEKPPKQPAKQPAGTKDQDDPPPAQPVDEEPVAATPAEPAEPVEAVETPPVVKPAPPPSSTPAPDDEESPAGKPVGGTPSDTPTCEEPTDPTEPGDPEPVVTPTDGATDPEACETP